MTPYSNLSYFLLIFAVLVPMMFAGRKGHADGRWTIGATILVLLVQYRNDIQINSHNHWPELVAVAAFGAYHWALLRLAIKRRIPGGSRLAIPLALVPLLVAKFLPAVAPDSVFGFVGISYVTFRALDMLWAVTDGVLAEVAFADFAVFLFFFPTISSGPIDRFRRFKGDWRRQRAATEFWQDFDASLPLLMRGLLYKFVIATLIERNLLGPARDARGLLGAMEYAYVYSAYLFFDFAGYSAFAIGVSRWFGITTPPNFNLPWAAPNIREFWNRWHMSLSFWFRDHVYSRFLLAAVKGKWFKKRETAGTLGYFVSFGLMGLWHGASWFYVAYGIYHALLFVIFDAFTRWKKRHPLRLAAPGWKWAARFLTVHAVVLGFWLFSGNVQQLAGTGASSDQTESNEPLLRGK
jgi:membrane protein involved in D-alanine export